GEVKTLRTAVADLEEERASLRRELDDLRTRAEALAAPARVVRAAPRPAPAVALEHRAGGLRSMAIDLSGPDSRVVPALLVLAEGEDDELGEAALDLLRERLGPLLDDPPADEGRARPRGPGPAVLASLGTLLGPLGRSLDPE